jgi:hypothetical protein
MNPDLDTLNRVFDSIMEGDKLDFTDDQLSTAISTQLQKVLNQVCGMQPTLLMGVTTLYVLLMTQSKTENVKLGTIGISNEKNKEYFENVMPQALKLASDVFNTLVKPKLK